jgi:hypothetical protein
MRCLRLRALASFLEMQPFGKVRSIQYDCTFHMVGRVLTLLGYGPKDRIFFLLSPKRHEIPQNVPQRHTQYGFSCHRKVHLSKERNIPNNRWFGR